MTYEQEENIMGWMIVAMGLLFALAVVTTINTAHTKPPQDAPCTHSH
jgi:hypothetical protein